MKIFKSLTKLVEASVNSTIKVVEAVGETAVNVTTTGTKVSEVIGAYAEAQVQVAELQIEYTVLEAKAEAEIAQAELMDRLKAVQAKAQSDDTTAVAKTNSVDINELLGM